MKNVNAAFGTYDMTSNDLDRQIDLLKYYPEIVAKYFKPALKQATSLLENKIRPNIPTLSGRAEAAFHSKVRGRGIETLVGQIGWENDKRFFYINIVEGGAKQHEIKPRGNRITSSRARAGGGPTNVLRFLGSGGQDGDEFTYSRVVHHPGVSKHGFMAAGLSAAQPIIDAEFTQATQGVFRDLEIK